jgi:hypothetical protein
MVEDSVEDSEGAAYDAANHGGHEKERKGYRMSHYLGVGIFNCVDLESSLLNLRHV